VSRRLTGKFATQEQILIAATRLFIQHGYAGTTISAVAQEAEVNRTTVFWHFGDKAGLFRSAFSRVLDPFRESLERDYSDLEPEKRLHEQLSLSELFAQEHGEEIAAFMHWTVEDPDHRDDVVTPLLELNDRFVAVLTQSIGAMTPPHSEPKLLAHLLVLAFDAGLLLSLFDTRTGAREERRAAIQAFTKLLSLSDRQRTES
jgi:AcrR family transcriptional regulator